MNKYIYIGVLGLTLSTTLFVQAQEAKQEDKLVISPTGRILMDAALCNSDNEGFVDGVAIPDIRVGAKASYGKYKAKFDIGYSYGKVSLKDIYVERKINDASLVRVGYFVHQFGLQSSTSSSMKVTMEEPECNEAFFNSRLIGAMYVYDKGDFYATGSVHVESEAMKQTADQMGKQGYGAMSRLVYRPLRNPGGIFHVGISGAYETPRYNSKADLNHSSYTLGSNFPSRVSKVKALNATISQAENLYKYTPEILAAYGPVGLETQYYNVNIGRKDGYTDFKAEGAYATLRALAIGGDYKYSNSDSGISTPSPKSLEFTLGYNYANMNDSKSNIYGGKLNEVEVGANYYLNKYMIARLRYSYTKVDYGFGIPNQDMSGLQARFQILF